MKPSMKKTFFLCICLALIFISSAFTLQLGTYFHIGNLSFDTNRTSGATGFSGTTYPWGLSVFGSEELSDSMKIDAGFTYDPILHNVAYTTFTLRETYFMISFGPYLGIFNSLTTLIRPGLSTEVRIEAPGKI